jgi:hypothetical protein
VDRARPVTRMNTIDVQTQTDFISLPPSTTQPVPSHRTSQAYPPYTPLYQLHSPDATHAGSAALQAARNTSARSAQAVNGNSVASVAATLAQSQHRPTEARKPDRLSSSSAAASLAHKTNNINERSVPKDAGKSAIAALRSHTQSSMLIRKVSSL